MVLVNEYLALVVRRGAKAAEVKKAVTGHGRCEKEEMAGMVGRILDIPRHGLPLDASDALAVAASARPAVADVERATTVSTTSAPVAVGYQIIRRFTAVTAVGTAAMAGGVRAAWAIDSALSTDKRKVAPCAAVTPPTISRINSGTRPRTSSLAVRTVPLSFTSSVIMLNRLPP